MSTTTNTSNPTHASTASNDRLSRIWTGAVLIVVGLVVGFLANTLGTGSRPGAGVGVPQAQAEPAVPATKWEYKSVEFPTVGKHDEYDKAINDNARDGWELCQFPHVSVAIYRRAK
jgi:hypothetical protein